MEGETKNIKNTFTLDTMIGDILGIVNALEHLGQTDKFKDWLVSYHGIEDHNDLLEGYKFALNVLIRCLHDAIASSLSLNLSEDIIFSRARFVGIPLHR